MQIRSGRRSVGDLARQPWRGIVYLADTQGDPVADFQKGCGDILAILHSYQHPDQDTDQYTDTWPPGGGQ